MKCFRSLEYIFKFIIQSRLLFARATAGQYEDSFKRDLYCVFAALNKMLGIPYEMVLLSQIALLLSIAAVFEQLIAVLPILEVAKLTCTMLDSVPREPSLQLTQAKLVAIKNLTASSLFRKDDESRNMLLVTICRHLRIHLARREELRSCKRGRDTNKVNNCIHHDVETLCLSVLDVLIQTILIVINANGPVLGCLVACLIGLLQLLDEYHYARLWEELTHAGDRKPLKDFLLRVFLVLREKQADEKVDFFREQRLFGGRAAIGYVGGSNTRQLAELFAQHVVDGTVTRTGIRQRGTFAVHLFGVLNQRIDRIYRQAFTPHQDKFAHSVALHQGEIVAAKFHRRHGHGDKHQLA